MKYSRLLTNNSPNFVCLTYKTSLKLSNYKKNMPHYTKCSCWDCNSFSASKIQVFLGVSGTSPKLLGRPHVSVPISERRNKWDMNLFFQSVPIKALLFMLSFFYTHNEAAGVIYFHCIVHLYISVFPINGSWFQISFSFIFTFLGLIIALDFPTTNSFFSF